MQFIFGYTYVFIIGFVAALNSGMIVMIQIKKYNS